MLNVINLDFDYQDQLLLNNVSFHLPKGGLLHLRGANGAGKTTLLKLIAGLYRPQSGEIQFFGQNIDKDRAAYQQQLCFVGHKTGINPNLTLRENCYFDLHTSSTNLPQKIEEIDELVTIFKLGHYLDFPCGLLSAGQRRQVGLLRLWMSGAKLWLLDEPLVALDERAIEVIMSKIEAHRKQGGAVLLTSHQKLSLNRSDYQEYCL
ncbi:cytochrome c biogenesis heme-transporting ATPase CcmA [Legionella longbeachae]|uniref:Heme exporter protein CcmA n=1 Tax=Legionella longbeachae serogroup 1 (strain NSW150) TaxID=661367 RepID=D3HIX4_LEGLN|nr:cytochrome c biogenesis heme-transporting ATPase CcmA [Legionella longbeachae]CBJ12353.1 heme exporter protein CcmA [Legionella longbeachae NSW150]VEE02862.1 heme exporter protein CcmA [Legionella oakridgensis]HBD7398037.1 cytochrome c biogenesis heme-transporting ATPase CcmA [Legionella pneumophila]ARB90894.1 cytochrome c biogenesis heme-transporting ATPase CcmA [Legionella longbeachae]ARM32674.1 cytochrome c biogenesis heme-transporting ATPase CcmA [Legionella longbeachae]